MNIFNMDFCLVLQAETGKKNYRFPFSKPKEILKVLKQNKGLFPQQAFYVKANDLEDPLSYAFNLLTHPKAGSSALTVCILFKKKQSVADFGKSLEKKFFPEPAAGGVPIFSETGEILMIKRKGKWDLAKGKLEKGETSAENAMREVEEETGMTKHQLGPQLSSTYHVYIRKNRWTWKTTDWFLMPVSEKEALVPQIEEKITDVRWFKLDDLRKKIPNTYPLIEEIVREVLARSGA